MMFQSDPTQLLTGGNETQEETAPEDEVVETQALELEVDVAQYLPDGAQPAWEFVSAYPLILVLLMGAIGWGIGKILQAVVGQVLEQAAKRTKTDLDDRLIKLLSAPIIQTTARVQWVQNRNGQKSRAKIHGRPGAS